MNDNKNVRDLIIPVGILIGAGILMIYSSSAFISTDKYGSSFHYLFRHILTVLVGFTVLIFLARVDYHRLRFFVKPLLALSVILLILVFVPGIGVSAGPHSEVKRWIKLWPSTFQPSELVKITTVLFLADYMSINMQKMKDLRCGVVFPVAVMAVFQCIILVQPDFGAVMSIGILTLALLFIGGIKWKHMLGILGVALPVLSMLVLFASYRIKRIMTFLDPWQDPQGSGFQLIQSFIAFGRGGITGVGIGNSKQKLFFLPEAHTDFIFSLIGEELGLIGALKLLGLFLWLFIKGFKIAMRTEDSFAYYLALGLTLMIGSQALINFAVSTGVMPTKGLPLPFISYGGSAFFINMAAVGILINISKSCCGSPLRGGETAEHKKNYPDGQTINRACLNYFSFSVQKPGKNKKTLGQPINSDSRWRRFN